MNTFIDRYLFRFAVAGTVCVFIVPVIWRLIFGVSIQTYLKGL